MIPERDEDAGDEDDDFYRYRYRGRREPGNETYKRTHPACRTSAAAAAEQLEVSFLSCLLLYEHAATTDHPRCRLHGQRWSRSSTAHDGGSRALLHESCPSGRFWMLCVWWCGGVRWFSTRCCRGGGGRAPRGPQATVTLHEAKPHQRLKVCCPTSGGAWQLINSKCHSSARPCQS